MITCVVAMAKGNVIGAHNTLPWRMPADLRHFKALTVGKTVVMGTKTFHSIIEYRGAPLPDRQSVVLTHNKQFSYPGVEVLYEVADIPKLPGEVCIIGGAQVYNATLHLVSKLYVTEIHAVVEGDAFFPEIKPLEWREVSRQPHKADQHNPHDYDFVAYERRA
ncbi:MAG: dihydrofolate reductase [Candidatus Saccharimonadales bacterium]